MSIEPSFRIVQGDPFTPNTGKGLTLEYDNLIRPSHVFFSKNPPTAPHGGVLPAGANKWLRLINVFGSVTVPDEFMATRLANNEHYIGVVVDDGSDTVLWYEHVETADKQVPPPLPPTYDPKKYWGAVLSVTQDAVNAINHVRVNQLSGYAYSLYREDPIFGRIYLRGADKVALKGADDPHRLLRLIEDGEVPLDTGVKYCLIEHFSKNMYERPVTQLNLLKNPSFEINVTDGGWDWNAVGRTAKHVVHVPDVDIKGTWDTNATIVDGTYDTSHPSNVTVTALSDAPVSITSAPVAVHRGERYEIHLPITASFSTRDIKMIVSFYGDDPANPGRQIAMGTAESQPVSLQAAKIDQTLTGNFFVPRDATSLTLTITSYDDGRATSAAGEMFSLEHEFHLEDLGAQERISGLNAAELSGTTLHEIPAPAGTTGFDGLPVDHLYPLLNLPTPAGGIQANTHYRVTGNVIVWDNPDQISVPWRRAYKFFKAWNGPETAGLHWRDLHDNKYLVDSGTVPVTWRLSKYIFSGDWDDPVATGLTWDDVAAMSYALEDTADVFLVCYDAAGQVLTAKLLGKADHISWTSFQEMLIPPAGTVTIGLAHSAKNYAGHDTHSLKWHVDAFMLEHELFNQFQLPYLDGDQRIGPNDKFKGTVGTQALLPSTAEVGDIYLVAKTTDPAHNGHAFKWTGVVWEYQGPYRGSTVSTVDGRHPQFTQPGWQIAWLHPDKPHNSESIIIPPQNLITCSGPYILHSAVGSAAAGLNCVTVHLTDPLLPRMNMWAVFASLGAWEHPARVERHAVVNRYTPVPVNDIRQSALNTLTVITKTHEQRVRMRRLLQSGRTLLLQFSRLKDWGDVALYISIDSVNEGYIAEDLSQPERRWELPFQVVSRPMGYLAASTYITWDKVRSSTSLWRTWDELNLHRSSWFDLYTNDQLESNNMYASPISGGQFAVNSSTIGVTVPLLQVTSGDGTPPKPPGSY